MESGSVKKTVKKSSDWIDQEKDVKGVLGQPQYQQLMVASDKDSLDHLAILKISRQIVSSGIMSDTSG